MLFVGIDVYLERIISNVEGNILCILWLDRHQGEGGIMKILSISSAYKIGLSIRSLLR